MVKIIYSLFIWCLCAINCISQSKDQTIINYADSIFSIGEAEADFPGLSCVYVSKDTTWFGSYGSIEWENEIKVDANTLFQLGSLGKVLTSIAVLQQVEKGNLDLDQDVTSYLGFEFSRDSDFNTLTLRHLLTHTAGMNDRNIGYLSKELSTVEDLGKHLVSNLPSFYQSAGLEINYSNYSYALAGYIVERSSGSPFQEYVRTNVFEPLGMKNTYVGFDSNYESEPIFAKGHVRSPEGFNKNQEYARHALPAGSLISSASDMRFLMQAFNQRDLAILSPESWKLLFTRQYSNHEQLLGYSLGLEEQLGGSYTYWAKGGMLNGYLSQVIFLPDSTSLFIAVNTNDDTFLERFHAHFINEIWSSYLSQMDSIPLPDLSKYAGEYRNARYDRDGVENIISLFRGAFNVWEGKSGLLAFHNGEMQTYKYSGDNVFFNSTNPSERMVFISNELGKIEKLYRSSNIAGLSVPATYEKTRWYNSPTLINEYYGFILLVITLYGVSVLFAVIVWVIRIRRPSFWKWKMLSKEYYIIAALGIFMVVFHITKALIPLIRNPFDFLFGLPADFLFYNQFALVIPIIALISLTLWILSLLKKIGSVYSRFIYGLYSVSMLIHSFTLIYWNFI